MIVCDLSKVEAVDGGWRVGIPQKISGALGLFPGQTLFASSEEGSMRLFLSSVRLNPSVNYFRIYLEDVRGSLARITRIFKDNNVNILSGGAFSFGNLWVSEFIVDFKGAAASPDVVGEEIEGLGGFVSARELTELFPKSFDLTSEVQVSSDEAGGTSLLLSGDLSARIGLKGRSPSYALLNAWPRVKALTIGFHPPDARLLRISAKIRDVPGSLNALAESLRAQVDLQAIDELHHDAVSGEWLIIGVLVIGDLGELRSRAGGLPTVLRFDAEPLGWKG